MSKNKNVNGGYNDIPDYSGYCPDCPECGSEMRYSYNKSEFKCFDCGLIMDEDDWDFEHDEVNADIPPYGCRACGGPWPNCKTSCKLFDD